MSSLAAARSGGSRVEQRGRWPTGRSRRALAVLGIVVVFAVGVFTIGPRGQPGPPLDPFSTGPAGTRGILEVLERLGVDVRVQDGLPGDDVAITLVIQDDLPSAQRDGLKEWVSDGGTLVTFDPFGELSPQLSGLTGVAFTEPTIEPACDDPATAGVARVALSGGSVFRLRPGDTGCFPRNGGFFMVRRDDGAGQVVAVGGAFTLTNELLDDADTALFLTNLLTPPDRRDALVVLRPDPQSGEDGLTEILPEQVDLALLQIAIAWLVALWWRARRLGRPVEEPAPVRLDAAETTIAVGNLLQRAGHATDAARLLRERLDDEVRSRLGVQADVAVDDLVEIAHQRLRSGADAGPSTLHRTLLAPLPDDDPGLLRFSRDVAAVRAALRSVARQPAPSTHTPDTGAAP